MISFITSIESRILIATGKRVQLSPQYILSCNFFNEGCLGGWPLLNGFFGEAVSIPLESCAPYRAQTLSTPCSDYRHCEKAVKVTRSFYIGGFYGASSEEAMMKELFARGPIVGDIRCPLGFSIYKEGIFSEEHERAF